MAAEGDADREMKAHRKSYQLFTGMMFWGTVVSLLVAALVVFIIS